jgi:hypothetical protein
VYHFVNTVQPDATVDDNTQVIRYLLCKDGIAPLGVGSEGSTDAEKFQDKTTEIMASNEPHYSCSLGRLHSNKSRLLSHLINAGFVTNISLPL